MFKNIGIFVVVIASFAACVGSGSDRPIAAGEGEITNPMDAGFMVGFEIPKIADRWSRTFGFYEWFDLGGSEQSIDGSDYSYSGDSPPMEMPDPEPGSVQALPPISNRRSWIPWDSCSVFAPRAGEQDINCDGVVDETDVELYRRFNAPVGAREAQR